MLDEWGIRGRTTRVWTGADVRMGFTSLMPLWPGVIAFAIAFAVTARSAGFSGIEILATSVLVFAGSAQVATVALYASGAAFIPIVLTTLLINLRHTLYGLSLSRWLPERSDPPKPLLAFFLTDESYGISTKAFLSGNGSARFLFGCSISLWVTWISSTVIGVLIGGAIPSIDSVGLDFVFPLTFVALLAPLLRSRIDLLVVAVAAGFMLTLGQFFSPGMVIVPIIAVAALTGVLAERKPRGTAA